jgi:hypothetical protein
MSHSDGPIPYLTLGAAGGAEPDCVHWLDPLAWADQEPLPETSNQQEEAPNAG